MRNLKINHLINIAKEDNSIISYQRDGTMNKLFNEFFFFLCEGEKSFSANGRALLCVNFFFHKTLVFMNNSFKTSTWQ